MKLLQSSSELNQATRSRGIHVINSFASSYIQQYKTQGATSQLFAKFEFVVKCKKLITFCTSLNVADICWNMLSHTSILVN